MMKKNSFIRRIFTGDNLPILRSMDSETVDLIYLDPPFNSGKQWKNPVEAGGHRALASFKDTWELSDSHPDEEYALGQQHREAIPLIDSLHAINGGSWRAYLIYMGVRLAEMRRILKPTGSIYYHCDPVMAHGVKLLMDAIFDGGGKGGKASGGNFISEIVWNYGTPSGGRVNGKKPVKSHENLMAYAKNYGRHVYYPQFLAYDEKYVKDWFRHTDDDGRKYRTRSRDGKIIRQYLDESKGVPLSNVWTDIMQLYGSAGWFPRKNDERTGYPTQKPLALLERVVKASSKKGDLVLDPFCGCATTCHAAESLGRQWIGIDLAEEAAKLIVDRLQKESDKQLKPSFADIEHIVVKGRTGLPKRTDLPKLPDSEQLKKDIYDEQKKKCAGHCDKDGGGRELPIDLLDIDHIIAKSRGGQDKKNNLQLLCRTCNTTKGGKGMDYLRRRILLRRNREAMREWRREWESKKDKLDSLRDDN